MTWWHMVTVAVPLFMAFGLDDALNERWGEFAVNAFFVLLYAAFAVDAWSEDVVDDGAPDDE